MADSKFIAGGWYVDATPAGSYVVTFPGSSIVEYNGSRFDVGVSLLYVRMSDSGIKFAGQGQEPRVGNWECESRGISRLVGTSFGVNPVIYRGEELLQAHASHQGYRFIDSSGQPVTGDASIFDGTLHEWTDCGDVRVGQYDDGQTLGAAVVINGTPRLLHRGAANFIRARRNVGGLSFSMWGPEGAHIYWFTRAELETLPVIHPPIIIPTPTPPPPKEPPVTPVIPEDEQNRAKAEIAAHPLGENLPDTEWTRQRAAALGGRWGQNGKRGDRNNPSHDVLAYRWSDDPKDQPILVDILGDGGGANIEVFQILPYPDPSGAVWLDPGKPSQGPTEPSKGPDPVTPTPTPTFDPKPLQEALKALEGQLAQMGQKLAEINSAVEEQILEVANIKAVLRTSISTSRGGFPGHSHRITMIPEEK